MDRTPPACRGRHAAGDIAIDPPLPVGERIDLTRRCVVEVMGYLPEIRLVQVWIGTAEENSA